jgi:uncharacterized protein YaaN involved in tellurite resistance
MPKTSLASHYRQKAGEGSPILDVQPDRLAALEAAVALIQRTLDMQFKRMAAMQADIDLLRANNGSRHGKRTTTKV